MTVLFGDLSDFTSWSEDLDPERVGGVTDRVLATLAGAVAEFGGHVDKLTGDGLMAVFGAPTAHEDDAERAVRAAARMQSAVRRVVEEEGGGGRRLGLRVGLNTGEVRRRGAGVPVVHRHRRHGEHRGPAVGRRRGRRASTPGRDTALATMAVASWRALPPLRLKGKREPVTAYELVGLRSASGEPARPRRRGAHDRPRRRARAAGRAACWRSSTARRPARCSSPATPASARPGSRRSCRRFAGELPERAGAVGPLRAVRRGPRPGGRRRHGPDRLRHRRGRRRRHRPRAGSHAPSRASSTRRTPAAVPSRDGRAAAHPARASSPSRSSRRARPRPPGSAAGGDQVRPAVAALFTALAADGPLLLVLDDLHWATPIMLDGVLDVAAADARPVLLLAVGRPDMLDLRGRGPSGPWWRALPEVEVLPLLPLEESATERLLRAYLGTPGDELDVGDPHGAAVAGAGQPVLPRRAAAPARRPRGAGPRAATAGRCGGELPEGCCRPGCRRCSRPASTARRRRQGRAARRQRARAARDLPRAGGGRPGQRPRRPGRRAGGRRRRWSTGGCSRPPAGRGRAATASRHTLVRDVAYAGLAKAERARRHAAAAACGRSTLATAVEAARSAEADGTAASQGERAVRLAAEMGLPPADPAWSARAIAFAALARLGRSRWRARRASRPRRCWAARCALASGRTAGRCPPPSWCRCGCGTRRRSPGCTASTRPSSELGRRWPVREDGVRAAGARGARRGAARARATSPAPAQALVSALAVASEAGADRLTGEALRAARAARLLRRAAARRARSASGQAHALAVQVGDPRGAGWALQHLAWSATTRGDYALADGGPRAGRRGVQRSLEDTGGLSWVAGTEGFVRLLQGRLPRPASWRSRCCRSARPPASGGASRCC